ncbi:hypothetical protein C2846_18215, partial [Pseudomonas jilinensis]
IGANRRAKLQITNGEADGLPFPVAELSLLIGLAGVSLTALIIQPGNGAIDKGTGMHLRR